MRNVVRAAGCLVACLVGLPGPAADSKLEPPDLATYLRWGPVRVRPGFQLSNLGYDDNILFSDAQDKVADYTATLAPQLEGLVLFGDRAFLTFRERLEYTVYRRETDQNFLNSRSSARLTVPLQRIGFFTDVGLDNVKSRPVDRQDVRPKREENRFGAGVILVPSWRSEIEIAGTFSDFRYTDPDLNARIAEQLDREERGTRIDAGFRIWGRSRILLHAVRKTIEFDEPFRDNGVETPKDTREWRALTGLEFGKGGTLTGSFLVGWAVIDAKAPTRPDLEELVAEAELFYRLTSSTRVKLEVERLPGFSVNGADAYYLETEAKVRVVHYLNRLFGVESGFGVGRLAFPESEAGSPREDDIRRYDVGVRLRLAENSLGRRVEYSLTVGRYRRESNVGGVEQSQNTVSFGAVLGF